MRQKCGRRKTCRIFSAYFQLIVVYCTYKQKKAEGDLPVNILIVADEPRLADVVYTGTDGLDYAQNGSGEPGWGWQLHKASARHTTPLSGRNPGRMARHSG